ncbi:MAG: hypothetical protein ACR2KJ_15785 [Jatrophihabitans sp.]
MAERLNAHDIEAVLAHFELVEVYAGVDTIVITHRDPTGRVVAEVLTFESDLVVNGHGTYPV